MATKKKNNNGINDAFTGGMNFIGHLWQNVEGELDKALKTARQRGGKSAETLRKTVDGLIAGVDTEKLRRKALRTGGELKKEFEKISNGMRTQIKSVESAIEEGIERIQDLEVVEYAKVKMNDTREQVLSALQIPSNTELTQLTHKLAILEKKLNALRKPEAHQ